MGVTSIENVVGVTSVKPKRFSVANLMQCEQHHKRK